MIESQLSFAAQQGDDSLIPFQAPPEYVKRWEAANIAALKHELQPDKSIKLGAKATIVTFSKQDLKAARHQKFQPVQPALA